MQISNAFTPRSTPRLSPYPNLVTLYPCVDVFVYSAKQSAFAGSWPRSVLWPLTPRRKMVLWYVVANLGNFWANFACFADISGLL